MSKRRIFICMACNGTGFGPRNADGTSPACPACNLDGCVSLRVEHDRDPEAVPNKLIRDIIAAEIRARENEARP